ncbi:MAG: 4Fe-4S binding protein [Chitinispirillales bacterium]|jgi:ferredoxin|nr:4Fe-4S binding protein [Chitinispirillales bacterium]
MRQKGFTILLFAITAITVAPVTGAPAQNRFPQPEFQSGYEIPANNFGTARAVILYYIDVAVLFIALCAASYIVLKKKSRRGVLILMLFSIAYFGFYKKGCICSIGAIQNVTAGALTGYAIPATVFLIFALPLAFALFFGRVFCSGVCPMGALQDVAAIRAKRVPARIASALGFIPHLYLGITILFVASGAGFPICKLDPFVGIFRLGAPSGMIAFGAILLLIGVFVARPYCRFLCPYGLILGWMSRLSKYRVKICSGKCVNCRLCENACPVDAIRTPTREPVKEERGRSIRRLKIYCALLPLWVIAGAAGGWFAADALSLTHPQVKLLRIVEAEGSVAVGGKSLEGEALRVDANVIAELREQANEAKRGFRLGMLLLGVYMGVVIGVYIIRQSMYKKRDSYDADPSRCVSCGRCYRYCPQR